MTTHCFSNKGKSVPYIPITPQQRFSMAMGYSYQPVKSSTTVTELGGGTNGTANNMGTGYYYPERGGGQIYLGNTTGYDPSTYKTITLNTLYTSAVSYVIGFEYVASNAYAGSDIIIGHYDGTRDYWVGLSTSYTGFLISAGGAVRASTGTAAVAGRKYIIMFGISTTQTGFFYVYDSAGNVYSNTSSVVAATLPTSYSPAVGSYGTFLPGTYIPRIYVGDVFNFNTLISTTNALAIKDAIKWKYGIS